MSAAWDDAVVQCAGATCCVGAVPDVQAWSQAGFTWTVCLDSSQGPVPLRECPVLPGSGVFDGRGGRRRRLRGSGGHHQGEPTLMQKACACLQTLRVGSAPALARRLMLAGAVCGTPRGVRGHGTGPGKDFAQGEGSDPRHALHAPTEGEGTQVRVQAPGLHHYRPSPSHTLYDTSGTMQLVALILPPTASSHSLPSATFAGS